MSFEHGYAVIMAGGGGTRLWPVSRRARPKQMLPLLEERSLFQATVERVTAVLPPEHIYVVTIAEQAAALRQQVPDIPPENFLLEPMPRGTASVIGLAAIALQQRDPEAVMYVLPSDHYIRNQDLFHMLLYVATDIANQGYLVTLGITPTYPATAYGYIERGERLPQNFLYPVYRVRRFKEKPSVEKARQMLRQGNYDWNSGMFIWRADQILRAMAQHMPDLKTALDEIAAAWDTPQREDVVLQVWPQLKNETIDYGIMEHAGQVAVLPASGLEWSDVGSWNSLFDVLIPDADGNIVFGSQHLGLETYNSLVYSNGDKRLVVTIGVEDLIIVEDGDVLLICHKDDAQKVRDVVDELKTRHQTQYL